jgi:hypothetical protein
MPRNTTAVASNAEPTNDRTGSAKWRRRTSTSRRYRGVAAGVSGTRGPSPAPAGANFRYERPDFGPAESLTQLTSDYLSQTFQAYDESSNPGVMTQHKTWVPTTQQ